MEKHLQEKQTIDYTDFQKIEMSTGTIIEAEPFTEAIKPSIKLRIDFGAALGIKKSSAQITDHYRVEDLIGKQILAVTNFPPKQIGKWMSEVLVLGVTDIDGAIVLVTPEQVVENGKQLH